MKFKYLKLGLPVLSEFFGNSILKPIIPVEISSQDRSLQYAALIDSGADFCIFHGEIGEYLGLDVKSGVTEAFGGVQEGSESKVFLHRVIINIGGKAYKTIVGFSYDIAKYGYGILGQKGFFDIFVVKFDLIKEEIELKQRK